MESVKTIMWRSTTPERYARVLRLLTLRRKKIESLTAEVAQKDAEVARLRGLFADSKQSADNAYCRYIDAKRKDLCLGQEIKLQEGVFTSENLEAHCSARELLGKHRALMDLVNRAALEEQA